MTYAIVATNGDVLNIVEWDGVSDFDPGEGLTLLPATADLLAQYAATLPTLPVPVVPQYQQRLNNGLTITSGNSALDGTYAVSDTAQRFITAVYSSIKGGDGLPGGGSTFVYLDATGAPHTFSADAFVALAKAIRDYVYALNIAALSPTPTWPSSSVTIL